MPKTLSTEKEPRKQIGIRASIIKEADQIIKEFPMYGPRLRLVESAIIQKIDEIRLSRLNKVKKTLGDKARQSGDQ